MVEKFDFSKKNEIEMEKNLDQHLVALILLNIMQKTQLSSY